jgi:hypothetical protein
MSEVSELEEGFEALQRKSEEYLPKVDTVLIHDLFRRERESPGVTHRYMDEVFTKPGLNTQDVRQYIINKTGMYPAIYDNGTHYGTNQKLTIEMLKEISDSEDVIEVTGEYSGSTGSWAASHDHRSSEDRSKTRS